MQYPIELYPKLNYKKIECDISSHYLIRYTNTSDYSQIIDGYTKEIKLEYICSPRDNIVDLSTCLLGVFETNHISIEIIEPYKVELTSYCNPNHATEELILNTHYCINNDRGCWYVLIEKINGQIADYTNQESQFCFKARCYIEHTPTICNFWHFSIRWQVEDYGEMHNLEEGNKIPKKMYKNLCGEARALIKKFAFVELPNYTQIEEHCYQS